MVPIEDLNLHVNLVVFDNHSIRTGTRTTQITSLKHDTGTSVKFTNGVSVRYLQVSADFKINFSRDFNTMFDLKSVFVTRFSQNTRSIVLFIYSRYYFSQVAA